MLCKSASGLVLFEIKVKYTMGRVFFFFSLAIKSDRRTQASPREVESVVYCFRNNHDHLSWGTSRQKGRIEGSYFVGQINTFF